jgi:endonuclease/exonuclease/phosphatase family metal-dependent hydrolase
MSIASPPVHTKPTSMRRTSAAPWFVAAILLGILVWQGNTRRAADATRPLTARGAVTAAPSEAVRFRVGTFNIHGGRGPTGPVDLNATADVLRPNQLDLVGLNEVRGTILGDQSAELAERLNMASVFVPTERRWWQDHFGNGVLTRRPLGMTIPIALPGTQHKRFRNAILTSFEVGGTTVRLLSTHIDTEVDRDRQLAVVFELFQSLEAPIVLMGDLNCTAEHPPLAALLAQPDVVDAVAECLGIQSRLGRIDHILVRGLRAVEAGLVETDASDHPHVWAELALP